MKLDKAIEILNDYLTKGYQMTSEDLHDAIALGFEALKRYRSLQLDPTYVILKPLPGEIED